MNPGDIYHDPSRPRQSGGYTSPIRATPIPHSQSQPFAPTAQPYGQQQQQQQQPYHPPQQSSMQYSQSQQFYPGQTQGPPQPGYDQYGDPFNNASNNENQWGQAPSGGQPFPSYNASPSAHRMSLPAAPGGALSPSHSSHPLEPPRTRYNSNPNFLQPGMGDNRLTSPPPLLQQHSSASDMSFPPSNRQSFGGPMGGPGYDDQGDMNDSAPLLNHAQPTFGLPQHNSGYHHAAGDMGMLPGQGANGGYSNSSIGFNGPNGHGMEPSMDDHQNNVHYGPVPNRVIRRNRTQKRVKLFRGHFVVDNPVPSILLDQCANRDGNEFEKMRYTAITCDPNDFVEDQYTLRQRLYDPPRQTELFIVVTMYNEDDELFCRTMRGVMQNVAHLCSRTKSKTWGKDGWKKVVICIVSDGRTKINPRTRSVLAALGVYQDGVAQSKFLDKPVTAHLYEYTTQLWISKDNKIRGNEAQAVPVQLIFLLKEKNAKKINSHRWFFNAFGECLKPNVCVLLDVGTQPGPDSIYHLWKAFDINSSVGGACGEIVALKGLYWRNLLNPLVAAQNFEYKMSNILDKPLESIFGYISVLPGAFSAYRYIALQNDPQGNGPLKQYFLGETMHGSGAGIFDANMYLAEDRILCWELVSKRGCKWTLHYVKSAYGITDVPDRRRRWLNGSFFAAIHSVVHFGYLYRSSHSFTRKFFLHIEFLYNIANLIFSWFALGNFYIAFYVLTRSLDVLGKPFHIVNVILNYVYIGLLLLCFLLALGNRPQGSVVGYTLSMVGFAILTAYMLFAAVYLAIKGIEGVQNAGPITIHTFFGDRIFRNIVVSLVATYGIYILASVLALDPWHMLTSFVQYLFLAPSYINVLNVYAFSNVHDVSWGTKGSDKASEELGAVKSSGAANKNEVTADLPVEPKDLNDIYQSELAILQTKAPKEEATISADQKQEDYYKNFRTNVLLFWVMSNGLLAAIILQTTEGGTSAVATTYMGVILFVVAGLAFFRFVGATAYLIVRMFVGE